MKKIKEIILTFMALTVGFTSCTLSEPKISESDQSTMLLKQVDMRGKSIFAFDYDSQNRIVNIKCYDYEEYKLTYPNTQSNIPSSIECLEYDYYDINGEEVRKVTEKDIWSDLRTDSDGRLMSFKNNITAYSYSVTTDEVTDRQIIIEYDPDTYVEFNEIKYNSEGNMINVSSSDGSNFTLEWRNGDLMNVIGYESSESSQDKYVFEYSDVINISGRWDAITNTVVGPIAVTGLFGKAPVHFVKSVKSYQGSDLFSHTAFSYNLFDNGLINMLRISELDENFTGTLNYSYIKAK